MIAVSFYLFALTLFGYYFCISIKKNILVVQNFTLTLFTDTSEMYCSLYITTDTVGLPRLLLEFSGGDRKQHVEVACVFSSLSRAIRFRSWATEAGRGAIGFSFLIKSERTECYCRLHY